jgi:hypothetical protein
MKKKLQDLGLTTARYNVWLKDPVFAKYISTRAEQLLMENRHEVDLALMDRVRAGDLKAIEYFNEMTGRYVRPRSNSYGINGGDVMRIIEEMIEIVDLRVSNKQEKLAIAEDLKRLIEVKALAQGLTQATIEDSGVQKQIVQGTIL